MGDILNHDFSFEYLQLVERRIDTIYKDPSGQEAANNLEKIIDEVIREVAKDLSDEDLQIALDKILSTVYSYVQELNKTSYLLAMKDSYELYNNFLK